MSPNTHLNDGRHRSIALIILLPIPYTCEICLSTLCLQAPNENHGIIGQLIELLIEGNSFGFTFSRLFYSITSLNITPEISRDLTLLIFVKLKSTSRKDEFNRPVSQYFSPSGTQSEHRKISSRVITTNCRLYSNISQILLLYKTWGYYN